MSAGSLADSVADALAGCISAMADLAPSASVVLAFSAGLSAVGCWRGTAPSMAPAVYRATVAVVVLGVGAVADPGKLPQQAAWLAGAIEKALR